LVGAGTGSAGTGVVVGATTIGTGTLVGAGTTGTGTALGGAADIVPSQVQISSFATAQAQVADSLTGTPLVVTVCEKLQDALASPPFRTPAQEVPSPGKLVGHCVASVGDPGVVAGTGMDEVGSVCPAGMSETVGAGTGDNESPTQDHTGLSRTQVHFLVSRDPPFID